MSSTLAKEFDHKLLVALKDARVAALNNVLKCNESDALEKIRQEYLGLLEAMNMDDSRAALKHSTKAIALLLNYQIKFL